MTTKSKDVREKEKRLAGTCAAGLVREGMRVGLGTGSTALHLIQALGERVRGGLKIEAVATSRASEELAREIGIPMIEPRRGLRLDLTIDGADEIDGELNLIKGAGGALLREKVVARASRFMLVIADSGKVVERLGAVAVPVEVVPFAMPWVADEVEKLGGVPQLRLDSAGEAWKTDQGNHVLDCRFGRLADPKGLGDRLAQVPGLVGHGLFIGMACAAIVADDDEVFVVQRGGARGRVEDLRIPG
jgi:ribose 5-phosphate isomerase A